MLIKNNIYLVIQEVFKQNSDVKSFFKKFPFFVLVGLIHLNGFSQVDYKIIRVSSDIELIELSENAYVHVSYSDLPQFGRVSLNGLIYINGNEAFLFDTPMTDSLTKVLFLWLKDSMKLNITGFIPNHWHADCMGGLRFLQTQQIESYANQMTIDIAKSKNLPVPTQGFKDSLQLKLGDKLINCYYLGAAHSLDNIVVWIPSEKILFAGCMIKSLNSKDLGNTVDGNLISYPNTIDKLTVKFPTAKIVIPGHGQFGGLELIAHTQELLNDR
jgi:metallo-beta-lactamase class B